MDRLYPDASEELKIAARCQHIARWRRPRKDYPNGRVGYLTWRRHLGRFHAETAGRVLREAGCSSDVILRVASLLRKERLKSDPEVQALEDVACIVFLRHGLQQFALDWPEGKVVDILRRTWGKMSDHGRAAALDLDLDQEALRLIRDALEEPGTPKT